MTLRVHGRSATRVAGVILLGIASLGPAPAAAPAGEGRYAISAAPLTAVRFTDEFWAPRLERNRTITIQHILKQNELTGRVANFVRAAKKGTGPFQGKRYNDTDVYKVLEAASYSLATSSNPTLDRQVDDLIAIVAAAQEPDGYLYTARTVDPAKPAPGAGPERWSYLHTSHELYNAGHLYEAAVAHYQATGKRTLLDVATRNADLVCDVFGPGKRLDTPGHEEIELALVKLWQVTGQRRYLDQARFFLDQRGRPHTRPPFHFGPRDPFNIYNDLEYRQDHLPIGEQTRVVGHSVRAMYMFAGLTDVATLWPDAAWARTADAAFEDVVSKRMYLTGGLGSKGETEAFGDDYVLPNLKAYTETCASIGGMLWYHRMFLREGDAKYLDVFERTLYNGYLSGVSQAGNTFFYQNPLESRGRTARSPYFEVACCPANLARLMAQLPALAYAQRDDEIFVGLYAGSEASLRTGAGQVRVAQQTKYPWDGHVAVSVNPDGPREFTLSLRIPGWAQGRPVPTDLYRYAAAGEARVSATVNGEAVPLAIDRGWLKLRRTWKAGDRIELDLPMPVRRVVAHAGVRDAAGKAAIERGPLVYCLEGVDNGGRVLDTTLALDAVLAAEYRPQLLGGVVAVTSVDAPRAAAGKGTRGAATPARGRTLTAVPYFAWANRGKGEMAVWIPVGN